ncbi:energy-coupling factor transporter ATPase [Salinicoccus sp. ID82-1]|uniref:Energy-coupling factor transporter ATP-binding protein EcfA2 n=1 Tax=Salinicoccus cyprini TaxID=2493691 RepID=A0A558AVE3_9STAP|nr:MULTISPECIES: energy-coupling factor transporter ATPase [Salinicoccus]MCG1010390.1 energy-coupling factor transporter ATPase [Salinicoccus sp. ID82-1]TVT28233.1 energy-coupling factor transporter ATPase [Salinicoccus cyprini]
MNITFKNLTSIYHENTPFEHLALNNITTTFEEGLYYGIVGHTGSGKSTMIQTLNGLLLPSLGEVHAGNIVLRRKSRQRNIHQVKKHVGMVFQFPEHQLFEETVLKDVMFGPKNMGMDQRTAEEKARHYLHLLNIDASLFDTSPFDLSGGQMRKVAIAGILAMEPEVLILDEPTAGLDPESHIETMELFQNIHQDMGITVILVTHDMNDVFQYTDQVKILSEGHLVKEGRTDDLLTDEVLLERYSLEPPDIVRLVHDLERKGITFEQMPKNVEAFARLYEEWRTNHAQ